ncbi:MAG: hypothetical protein Q4F75_09085 [Pseudomonadota bacterium]|nr:hypothetical protein [Pseudomonadota bacterium]
MAVKPSVFGGNDGVRHILRQLVDMNDFGINAAESGYLVAVLGGNSRLMLTGAVDGLIHIRQGENTIADIH